MDESREFEVMTILGTSGMAAVQVTCSGVGDVIVVTR
jgi:DNA-binding protein YbaB